MALARTSLREALSYSFLQITEANGYWTTIRKVYDPPINMEEALEFPSVNILLGREERLNDRLAGNNSLLDLRMVVTADVFLSEANNPPAAIDNVVGSVQKYFGYNFYVPGSGGSRTSFNALFLSATPFGTQWLQPNCGVSIELEVWYRIQLQNPEAIF